MVRVYFGEDLGQYHFGQSHPFGPGRIQAFWNQINKAGLDREIELAIPLNCKDSDLLRFHNRAYIERVKEQCRSGEGYLDLGDTPAFPGIYEAGCYVVGSGIDGIDNLVCGRSPRVFVPIAGLHHARRSQAGGFCVFNDIGVIIETLRSKHNIHRIAYVDIDAHHGDGVFYSYETDPDVIICDIHEDGRFLYPGTGSALERGLAGAEGTKMNFPLDPGSDDQVFFSIWPKLEEFLRAFQPEIFIMQAGADSIRGDPITHMAFSPEAHYHCASRLCRLADEYCNGRFIALGGGGYNLENIGHGWSKVVEAMVNS